MAWIRYESVYVLSLCILISFSPDMYKLLGDLASSSSLITLFGGLGEQLENQGD